MRFAIWIAMAPLMVATALFAAYGPLGRPEPVAFEYSTGGVVPRGISSVQILVDGAVRAAQLDSCHDLLHTRRRLSLAVRQHLARIAQRAGFFSLPPMIKGQRSIDVVGPSVTISIRGKKKTVAEGVDIYNSAFQMVYDALSQAAPLDTLPRCLSPYEQ